VYVQQLVCFAVNFNPQKLALTSPTCSSRSVGIVRLQAKAIRSLVSLVYLLGVVRMTIHTLVILALTISNLKSVLFWDAKCRSALVYRRFEGTQCFHLHGQRIRQERYQQEEGSHACSRILAVFLLVLFFASEYGDITILRNFSELRPIGYFKSDL
jgi:hypothetical protein